MGVWEPREQSYCTRAGGFFSCFFLFSKGLDTFLLSGIPFLAQQGETRQTEHGNDLPKVTLGNCGCHK